MTEIFAQKVAHVDQGPRTDFKIVGAGFKIRSKKLKIIGTLGFIRVQNLLSSKLVDAKSVSLKPCGCTCNNCTHAINDPVDCLGYFKKRPR